MYGDIRTQNLSLSLSIVRASKLRVNILILVIIICTSMGVIKHMVGHSNGKVLRLRRRHRPHTKKIGCHSTMVLGSSRRKVVIRIVIDVVGHFRRVLSSRKDKDVPFIYRRGRRYWR